MGMNGMTDYPKVSVIVPVYKAEAYLNRCVDSLLFYVSKKCFNRSDVALKNLTFFRNNETISFCYRTGI